MADLESVLIESLVAAGTVGLTVLTAYQLRRDRKEALARELADRVYVPMRKETLFWQDSESLPTLSSWSQLGESVPYLTMKVPKDLKDLFDKAEGIRGVISLYSRTVSDLIASFSANRGNNPKIHLMKDREYLAEIYPINIWKSGKSFRQYVEDYMARSYPLIEKWAFELWADVPVPGAAGSFQVRRVGETEDTTDFVEKLFKFLESKEEAELYRDEYVMLKGIGFEAQAKIEKQLRKRVAPQSSSPAKEPGNPLG